MLSRVSIRVRLTLWYVLLLAVVLAAFSAGVYLLLRHSLYQSLDESIQVHASSLSSNILYENGIPYIAAVSSGDADSAERFVRVFDGSGDLTSDGITAMGRIPVDRETVQSALAGKSLTRRTRVEEAGDPLRVRAFPIRRDGAIVGVLEVGQSEDNVSDTLSTLLLAIALAYPSILVLASLGGAFLAGRALSPVDKITRLARRLSAEDLGQRLDLALPDDEVGRLARTFDEMIARLDDSFHRQRRFTSDASHELRTPLTIIKGQIEVALQRERDDESYRQVLQSVNEEIDRLIRLAGSLLTLTRADAGRIPLSFESVDVESLVAGSVEHVRPRAVQKGVDLRLDTGDPITIAGDEDLLLQLVLNLLDNAVKYTPSGGQVLAGWKVDGQGVELRVQDTGIGIPSEHISHIFDRFYRVDKARSRDEGGVGLGLSIARWIAEAHGGSINVDSIPLRGSTFVCRLPAGR